MSARLTLWDVAQGSRKPEGDSSVVISKVITEICEEVQSSREWQVGDSHEAIVLASPPALD